MKTEVLLNFFKAVGLAKPCLKVWRYEGYYEDFSWESSYEDVSVELLDSYMTLEDLDKKIQDTKKKLKAECSPLYDIFKDAYKDPCYGWVEKACWTYPGISDYNILKLICLLTENNGFYLEGTSKVDTLREYVLVELTDRLNLKAIHYKKREKLKKKIKEIFI